MNCRKVPCLLLIAASLAVGMSSSSQANDPAGIPWKDFIMKSEFIFAGTVVKAESLGPAKPDRYTFRVGKVFKGPDLKEVTLDVPFDELTEGIAVNRMGIMALRRNQDKWELSVDERSWWPHRNEMTEDFRGLPVYAIPAILLHDMPKELGETCKVKRLFEDGYHLKEVFLYPTQRVDRLLGDYVSNKN